MRRTTFLCCLFSAVFSFGDYAIADTTLKSDNKHVRTWNQFAMETLALHEKLIAEIPHTEKTRIGGYAGMEEFYKEQTYYDKRNNKLISRVQWERDNPTALHTIEVFIRDEQGRVLRDYTAAYLPTYRNAPTQTLLSFHQYNGALHAFRTFDASGERIVERCTGELKDKEVNLLLDEDEIYAALGGRTNVMQQAEYKACFTGMPLEPGKYLTPQ